MIVLEAALTRIDPPQSYQYQRSERLRSGRDFSGFRAAGRRFAGKHLVVFVKENKYDYPRLGVRIGRSAGPAVWRNRSKRLMREFFRKNKRILGARDMYMVVKKRDSEKSKREYEASVARELQALKGWLCKESNP